MTPTKDRRWRVSVFGPGSTENVPKSFPLVHKSSAKQEVAQRHFEAFARQIGNGTVGRVIMHQGKLYKGSQQYIHEDTRWGLRSYGIVPAAGN